MFTVTAAAVFFVAMDLFARSGAERAEVDLSVHNWQVELGTADRDLDGWTITALSRGRWLLAATLARPLASEHLTALRVEGSAAANARIVWRNDHAPAAAFSAELDDQGTARLSSIRGWQGNIVAIGLEIRDPERVGQRIDAAFLQPEKPGLLGAMSQAAGSLTATTGVSQQTINFYAPSVSHTVTFAQFILALTIALITATLWWIPVRRGRSLFASKTDEKPTDRAQSTAPLKRLVLVVLAVLVASWLILDGRWQWNLFAVHHESLNRYAGLPGDRRAYGSEDGELARWIDITKTQIPETARVFVISDSDYGRLRAQYLLAPFNASGISSPAQVARMLKSGDYVLQIAPSSSAGVLQDRETLRFLPQAEGAAPTDFDIELLSTSTGALLLRVENRRTTQAVAP
ncbi:MAG: hypothetical protein ACK4IT_05010 [Thioalkalivibrionaceae bacterium]